MAIYQLYRQQTLSLPIAEAWSFFSSPHNLNSITPDFFHVSIQSPVPAAIESGLLIAYSMKAVGGWPMDWLSEVTVCEPPQRFIYQQRVGPFAFWSHEVRLTETAQGTRLEDTMFYRMPFGVFGVLMHRLLIQNKLQLIFDTRQAYLQQRWGVNEGI